MAWLLAFLFGCQFHLHASIECLKCAYSVRDDFLAARVGFVQHTVKGFVPTCCEAVDLLLNTQDSSLKQA